MKKYIISYILILVTNICLSQNSIVGDGFGGRLWYKPTNLSSYSYGGFMICGSERKLYGWGYSMPGLIKRGWRSAITSPTWAYNLSEVKYHSGGYFMGIIKTNDSGYVWGEIQYPIGVIGDVSFCDAAINGVAFVKKDGSLWVTSPTNSISYIKGVTQITGVNNVKRVAMGAGGKFFTLNSNGYIDFINVGSRDEFIKKPKITRLALKSIVDIKATTAFVSALDKDGNVFTFNYSADSIRVLRKVDLPFPAVAISGQCDGLHFLYLCENGYCYKDPNSWAVSYLTFIDSNVIDIMAGEVHDYYITSDKKFQQRYFYPDPGIDFLVDLNNNTCIETQDISFKTRKLCKGDSINVNEKYYSQDGTYKLDNTLNPLYLTIVTKDTVNYYLTPHVKCNNIKPPSKKSFVHKTETENLCINYFIDTIYRLSYFDTIKLYTCTSPIFYKGEIYIRDTQFIERSQTKYGCDSNTHVFIDFYNSDLKYIIKTFIKCNNEEFSYENLTFKTSGVFKDTIRNIKGCDSVIRKFTVLDSLCDLRVYIPDVFTPNAEGPTINNTFQPFISNCYSFRMEIYSRWGEKLYETTDVNTGWDGTYLGKMSPNSIYTYKIVITSKENKSTRYSGTFTLLR